MHNLYTLVCVPCSSPNERALSDACPLSYLSLIQVQVQKESVPDNSVTCLKAPFDSCDAGSTNIYFMNVTNAEDVLDGISGPIFEQVGPFYFTLTKYASNEYTSYPGRYGVPISALRHNYTDKVMTFQRHLSCPTCDLSLNIIGPNAIYLTMMKQTNWSESTV